MTVNPLPEFQSINQSINQYQSIAIIGQSIITSSSTLFAINSHWFFIDCHSICSLFFRVVIDYISINLCILLAAAWLHVSGVWQLLGFCWNKMSNMCQVILKIYEVVVKNALLQSNLASNLLLRIKQTMRSWFTLYNNKNWWKSIAIDDTRWQLKNTKFLLLVGREFLIPID